MEGHLRLSYCRHGQGRHEGRRAHQVGARPELAERDLHRRQQAGEGLAMNNLLDIKTPAAGAGRGAQERLRPGQPRAARTCSTVYWNLPTEALYEEIIFRGEARITRRRPGRRQHRQAHGPLGQRQVRRARAVDRGAHLVGRVQPAVQPREVQRAVQPAAGLPAGARRLRAGLLRRRRPEYRLPVRIITETAWHSLFARNMFILPQTQRGVPPARAGVHRHLRARSSRRIPQIDGTASNTFIVAQLRPAAVHHRQHRRTPARSRSRSSPC